MILSSFTTKLRKLLTDRSPLSPMCTVPREDDADEILNIISNESKMENMKSSDVP